MLENKYNVGATLKNEVKLVNRPISHNQSVLERVRYQKDQDARKQLEVKIILSNRKSNCQGKCK